jgi:hypothetical protein
VIRLADDGSPAAEICRRVGDAAELLGFARPSYEQVRVIVVAQRDGVVPSHPELRWRESQVSGRDLLLDVLWRTRPATDAYLWLAGARLPYRRLASNEPGK